MAPIRQARTHLLQPVHKDSSMTTAPLSLMNMAPASGQAAMQRFSSQGIQVTGTNIFQNLVTMNMNAR